MGKEEIYNKLSKLSWLMHRQHTHDYQNNGPFGTPLRGQGRVLEALRSNGELSIKDLSVHVGIRPQTLNETLNKLEKKEFVQKRQSPDDGRVMLVSLSEKGLEEQPHELEIPSVFDKLQPSEVEVFESCLDKIIDGMEKEYGVIPRAQGRRGPGRKKGR
ncbi:MAG: MarR family transcriptional regulator [Eubacteriaceae bacterium]|nr:MarR family transcriptional regulator [Eubacteriaceae bacterium]